jgi:hypothetical protein
VTRASHLYVVGALLLSLAFAGSASAAPFTINVRGSADSFGRVLAIGDFKPERDPTVGAALDAFGAPSSRRRISNWGCKLAWHGPGVKVLFANFGIGGACGENTGRSQTARAYGQRWRTARGLRVGNRLTRLRSLYPGAERHGRSWWLVTAVTHIGETRRYPVLAAAVLGGRVRSFRLFIGAAGD